MALIKKYVKPPVKNQKLIYTAAMLGYYSALGYTADLIAYDGETVYMAFPADKSSLQPVTTASVIYSALIAAVMHYEQNFDLISRDQEQLNRIIEQTPVEERSELISTAKSLAEYFCLENRENIVALSKNIIKKPIQSGKTLRRSLKSMNFKIPW